MEYSGSVNLLVDRQEVSIKKQLSNILLIISFSLINVKGMSNRYESYINDIQFFLKLIK